MSPLRYNPNGLHVIEDFGSATMMEMLPGLMPEGDDPGDRWDDSLMNYRAHVGNVGCIGEFHNKSAAIKACREYVRSSARADKRWFVERDDGEIVAERTR